MVDFAGWEMPVQYSSITAEHLATRSAVGAFDISHMGRLRFFGPEAARFLDASVTRRVTDMRPGQIRYGLVCNDRGGILDDVLVYRLAADQPVDDDTPMFQVVVNASNRAKIVEWFGRRLPDYATRLDDVTTATAMIAVQGPRAVRLMAPLVECDLSTMRYYTGTGDAVRRDRLLHQSHRLHGRRRLRDHLSRGECGRRVGEVDGHRRQLRHPTASALVRATRCASKRRCRSTGTSSSSKSIRFRPVSALP